MSKPVVLGSRHFRRRYSIADVESKGSGRPEMAADREVVDPYFARVIDCFEVQVVPAEDARLDKRRAHVCVRVLS